MKKAVTRAAVDFIRQLKRTDDVVELVLSNTQEIIYEKSWTTVQQPPLELQNENRSPLF